VLDHGAVGLPLAPREGIAPVRRAEDGAAQVGDAADLRGSERHDLVVAEQAAVAAADA